MHALLQYSTRILPCNSPWEGLMSRRWRIADLMDAVGDATDRGEPPGDADKSGEHALFDGHLQLLRDVHLHHERAHARQQPRHASRGRVTPPRAGDEAGAPPPARCAAAPRGACPARWW